MNVLTDMFGFDPECKVCKILEEDSISNRNLTKDEAIEFAIAMGDTHPPTNVNLIAAHITWWNDNMGNSISKPIMKWYAYWSLNVNDEEFEYAEFNTAYTEFTRVLSDIRFSN